jgi:hypothetical protein
MTTEDKTDFEYIAGSFCSASALPRGSMIVRPLRLSQCAEYRPAPRQAQPALISWFAQPRGDFTMVQIDRFS